MNIVLSVHVPKTAGSSFRVWLEEAYGESRIIPDYSDRPADPLSLMNTNEVEFLRRSESIIIPKEKEVIHGHYWINKYRFIKNSIKIAFLRDPIERVISHYFFWLKTDPGEHSLHKKFLEESPSIVDFARYPLISGFYKRSFFRDTDMESFDFIGRTEEYNSEIVRLEKILGKKGVIKSNNESPYLLYNEKKRDIINNNSIKNTLDNIFYEEIEFYQKWAGT